MENISFGTFLIARSVNIKAHTHFETNFKALRVYLCTKSASKIIVPPKKFISLSPLEPFWLTILHPVLMSVVISHFMLQNQPSPKLVDSCTSGTILFPQLSVTRGANAVLFCLGTGENYQETRPIDVYVLNTTSFRWKEIPIGNFSLTKMVSKSHKK